MDIVQCTSTVSLVQFSTVIVYNVQVQFRGCGKELCLNYCQTVSECPRSPDHTERFACPRPDRRGRFRCIDDRSLCDGFYDCPGKEDESPEHCLFFKTVSFI